MALNLRSAVSHVNKNGMLLIFPLSNRAEPRSLWAQFFPRTEMRWEWDQDGDTKVADLWHLRERLSTSRQVVYSKWYRGRATVMSFEVFKALFRRLGSRESLSFQAREILDVLDENSPQSTKSLKQAVGLKGRELERHYSAAMKELWSRLLIVAFGEVDEGAFPSLAMGTSKAIFEDLCIEAAALDLDEAEAILDRYLPKGSAFRKYADEVERRLVRLTNEHHSDSM